jgi:poly-gamma-glutamate synthesis protein (capsule biosynthesis protein)
VSSRSIALIVGGSLALAGVVLAGRSSMWQRDERDARLLFTGDILLGRQVKVEIDRTGGSPLDSVASLFAKADWVAGNLESAVGNEADCRVKQGEICFTSPDTTVKLLARAGIRAVSIENNHAGDAGAIGRTRTRVALRSSGILGLDFAHSPRFVRVGDRTVAMITVSLERAADGQVQTIPSVDLAQKLRLAHSLANLVVVSIHWGNELQDWPSAEQRSAAEWLVDHGADLVVGHHPHVVQRPDCVHGRPVFYSLGNHVFDQKYPETKEGLIADCTIRKGRVQCGGIRTHARRGSAMPVVTGEANDLPLNACTFALGNTLTMSGLELRPAPWTPRDTTDGVVLEGWKDGVRRWQTRSVSLVSLQPGLATDSGSTLLFALERHPSEMDGEAALRPHVYDVNDHGLVAKWRGTSLAWPLIDAVVDSSGQVCALHRGDSFIRLDPTTTATRTMRYRWNGFGFSATTPQRSGGLPLRPPSPASCRDGSP